MSDPKTKTANAQTWTKNEAIVILRTFAIGGSVDIVNILKTFPSFDGKTLSADEVIEHT
jgi:hypothetical protein